MLDRWRKPSSIRVPRLCIGLMTFKYVLRYLDGEKGLSISEFLSDCNARSATNILGLIKFLLVRTKKKIVLP